MWKVVSSVRKLGTAIILTSHRLDGVVVTCIEIDTLSHTTTDKMYVHIIVHTDYTEYIQSKYKVPGP